jgi:hypothetical protein
LTAAHCQRSAKAALCTEKADMFRRIQGLQLGLEQCRNPFEPHPDLAGQHYLFLYLTGRGEYSYLFPQMTEGHIINAAAQAIPLGYTQIWILEWVRAMRPKPGQKIRPSQRRAVQHLSQASVQEGHSYVLIGEHGQCFGCTENLSTAIGASKLLNVARQVRIALGLLQMNVTWH